MAMAWYLAFGSLRAQGRISGIDPRGAGSHTSHAGECGSALLAGRVAAPDKELAGIHERVPALSRVERFRKWTRR